MRLRSLLLFSALFFCSITRAQVTINEFSAANFSDVTDNHSNYEDWIELYNQGGTSVDLAGYYLSDRISSPTKWQIPAGITIPAGGFLRFWCSGRDAIEGASYHTNFKITQTNDPEAVVFADPSGTIIDQNTIETHNQKNHSWGRYPDGGAIWCVYTDPTPNASNTTAHYTTYAVKPDMEPNSGNYSGSVSVTITDPDPLVTIRYTTDGKTPTTTSTAYTGPINITSTTILRTAGFSSDAAILKSFTSSNTYFIDEVTTVPVISVAGDNVDELIADGNSWTYDNTAGSFELFDKDFNLVDEAEGTFDHHGNDSWGYDQRGFDFVTRDQFGYDYEINTDNFSDVTDRTGYQKLILKAAANDNYPASGDGAHVRDAYVHHLAQSGGMDLDARSVFFGTVYLNGEYWGVYDMREKADDHDFTDYYYDQDEFNIDYILCWGGTWAAYGTTASWPPLSSFITSSDMTDPANYAYATDNLDIYSLIDYITLNTETVCTDWLNWNTGFWRGYNPEGTHQKWGYILWDEDATFGHYINYTGVPDDSPTASPCDPLTLGYVDPNDHINVLNALLENEDFYAIYVNRFADHLNTTFSCENMLSVLDSMIAVIDPEMTRQTDTWGGTYSGWLDKVDQLRTFIEERCAYMASGIEDCFDTPAYPITFDVNPPAAGNVLHISTTTPGVYPWNATYFGGINLPMKAIPAAGYIFDHWEFLHNTPSPSSTVDSVSVNLTSSDTVTAYFIASVLPSYNFNLDVIPAASGNVTVNSFTPASYPYASAYLSGTMMFMNAAPSTGYTFDYWELEYHVVNPDPFTESVNFSMTGIENVTAHFKLSNGVSDLDNAMLNLTASPTVTDGNISLSYQLSENEAVSLDLYAMTGEKIAELMPANTNTARGSYTLSVDLDSYHVAKGMYFIKLQAGGKESVARIAVQ